MGGGDMAEEFRRQEAISYSAEVNKLMANADVFKKAWSAVKERKGYDFEDVCMEAGITDKHLIKCMRAKLIEGEDKNSPTW
jgi:hypothetical protein